MSKKRNRSLAEFYARYPYPAVSEIFYDRNLVDQHFYLAGLPKPDSGRILVAGCGTTEALTWGLSAPNFEVQALDLSETSLEISARLAEQLDLRNVKFRRADFEDKSALKGTFDLISCLGVVHHLAKPQRALERLAKRLAPGGVMSLMVYTHTNRSAIQDAQRVIRRLTQGEVAEAREATAVRICEAGQAGGGRLSGTFETALRERAANPPSFADTMLNPREVSYSVPELAQLLDDCGLELAAPVHPFAWVPYGHLGAEELERLAGLPLVARMDVGDLLCNPLCWVVVRRKSDGAVAPTFEGPGFWSLVPQPLEAAVYEVQALQVRRPASPIQVEVQRIDAQTVAIARSPRHPARFHPVAAHMLALVDGARDLETIGRLACEAEGLPFEAVRADVAVTLKTMMHDMNLFTPAQSARTAASS